MNEQPLSCRSAGRRDRGFLDWRQATTLRSRLSALLQVACLWCFAFASAHAGAPLVLSGGTVVDLSREGRSGRDLRDAVVVIRDGRIEAAGPRKRVRIPADANVIDASGSWIVPGLNDVFATVNNQSQANAFLYLGVTGVVGIDDEGGRRGPLFRGASPGPRVYPLDHVLGIDVAALPEEKQERMRDWVAHGRRVSDAEIRAEIDRKAEAGVKVLLLYYTLTPKQLKVAAAHAHKRGIATIGELGASRYAEGITAGVMAFVHTSRYSLDLAPPELRTEVALEPFGPPRRRFYEFLMTVQPGDAVLAKHANTLARGRTALIPTAAMNYLDLPGHANPWNEPVAAILDQTDIHLPADRYTGMPAAAADAVRDGFPKGASAQLEVLEQVYCRAGASYLAGSGTDAFGTMPGISLHVELQRLVAACLTPRQAVAAATANVGAKFGWRQLGRIAPGADADVLVLDADPSVDIANLKRIRHLVVAGALIDREQLLRPEAQGAGNR